MNTPLKLSAYESIMVCYIDERTDYEGSRLLTQFLECPDIYVSPASRKLHLPLLFYVQNKLNASTHEMYLNYLLAKCIEDTLSYESQTRILKWIQLQETSQL